MPRWKKLGIIAGGGALPARIASACAGRGEEFHVVRIIGSADAGLTKFTGDNCAISEAGKVVRSLKAADCDAVILVGRVKRPDFRSLKPDWRGAALLPKLLSAAAKGDGAILDVLVDMLESEGFLVVGAEEALEDLTAGAGALGEHLPTPSDMEDIKKAASLVKAIGSYDVGQGAVVAGGRVLGIEAAEGTDEMLRRCAAYKSGTATGVLVKRPKPGQELRVDLPAIGPETVRLTAEAGLRGIAIEAGFALVIDRNDMIARANDNEIFVYGFTLEEIADAEKHW
ncbi:MAG: UDP-2,3-diacylglucosamine diphosphatase LpxI [Marinicaulis sp.]|nr:UDP-2,3-diacylglucosamine diphosphatase LpxI [Marinicaulis sp.]